MSEVIITPDMEQDIVINTTKELEVVTIPIQTPLKDSITITTTDESEVFNVPN
mgnify:FL=1